MTPAASAAAGDVQPARGRLLPSWTLAAGPLGLAAALSGLVEAGPGGAVAAAALLFASVFAAVHHAELIALRVGEPLGTLVLAVAVTIIEVSVILSLMLAGEADQPALARDTVFAAIMIILGGIIGLCLLAGGMRHYEQRFTGAGATGLLAALATLAVMILILPNFTSSVAGPYYNAGQLGFVAAVGLALYATVLLVQTVRHRDYFIPADDPSDPADHAAPPPARAGWLALGALILCLAAVVLLAEELSHPLETAVVRAGLPVAVVGVAIALTVLLPEGLAAWRAARLNRLQTSINLALGSALATIGLSIPAIAMAALWLDLPLALGLEPKSVVLLTLALFVSGLTLSRGQTTILQGAVHLAIFGVYLLVTIVP